MINLLPPTYKKEILAARSNVLLVRYVFLFMLVIGFLIGGITVTHLYLVNAAASADQAKIDNESRVTGLSTVEANAQSIRSDLSRARTLFDGQVRYSKALLNISKALPEGTALSSIKLDQSSFGTPTTLSVLITGEQAATQLKNSFSQNAFFSNVSFGKLTINDSNSTYPYTIELNVTINKSIAS